MECSGNGMIKSLKGHPEKVLDLDVIKAVGMLERQYNTAIIPELRDSLESAIAVIRQIAADKDAGNAQTAHNAAIISEQADNPADPESIPQSGGGGNSDLRLSRGRERRAARGVAWNGKELLGIQRSTDRQPHGCRT